MEELMNCIINGTKLSVTYFNCPVSKRSSTQDVVGDLMNKLWMSDVVAVGTNSSRDTHGAGWLSVVKNEANVELK